MYFEIIKLPRYTSGQKEYEVEMQYSSGLFGFPERNEASTEDATQNESLIPEVREKEISLIFLFFFSSSSSSSPSLSCFFHLFYLYYLFIFFLFRALCAASAAWALQLFASAQKQEQELAR